MNMLILILFYSVSFQALLTPIFISKFGNDFEWLQYKKKYGKNFTPEEDERRKRIFFKHLEYINRFNANSSDLKLAINRFAHLEDHEFPHKKGIKAPIFAGNKSQSYDSLPVPKEIDWRNFGVVSPVINQGPCGSCYAFSAIETMNSAFAKVTGKLVELSVQQIVDCSVINGNYGCDGGYMTDVFEYAIYHGVVTNQEYEYTAHDGRCRVKLIKPSHLYKLHSYNSLPPNDEKALIRTVGLIGPVSISIDDNHREFRFYKSGVIRIPSCSSTDLNHAVVVVGYNLEKNPYYIIKNSWGTDWGMDGYFKMAVFENNMCGVATSASYPIPLIPEMSQVDF